MTDYTPILHLPQVASNQEQKEATINTAIAILEAAMNDTLAVSLASGDVALNQDQFTKYFLLQFSGHTVARGVTVPATQRWFAVENQGSASITFAVQGAAGLTAELPAGKIGLLVSDGADLRFVVPDAANGMGLLADLSDVSGVPTNNQILRFTDLGLWEPWSLTLKFTELSDAPLGGYAANAGRLLSVKADGTGLEWQVSSANVNSFVDLDDTPNSYTGAGGRYIRVNSGGTGLVFATPALLHNSDFPSSYANQEGKFLQVNPDESGNVIFANPKLSDLSDGPGQPTIDDALLFVRVNAAGTGLEFVTGTGGPVNFVELQDTPGSFSGQKGKIVRVSEDEDQLIFDTLPFTALQGVPSTYQNAANRFVKVNASQNGLIFSEIALKDLSDVPDTYVASRYLRINASGNGVEFVKPALTELDGFPSSYAGQGGKFVQVRPDETGLRFSTSAVSVSFLGLTDTPEDYAGAANKLVVVNATGNGLIFAELPSIPTTLESLTDVTFATPPAEGQVLTFAAGQWIAADGGSSSVAALADLIDVDLTTTAPTEGQSLVYQGGVWVPATIEGGGGGPGATALNDLTDVDLTDPPVEGEYLTYVGGQWVAGPGGTSNVETLDDIQDVTLTDPTSGQVLTYRDGGWVNESPQGAGVSSNGSHAYWRLLINETDGDAAQAGIQDIWFRRTKTGAQLATGGTATASTQETNQPPSGAFDGVVGGAWFSAVGNPVGQWIAYAFAEPVEVRYLDLMGSQDYPTRSPRAFDVQWSDDGIDWTTAWSVTGQTGWAPSQIRQFHAPLDLFFTDLADVPPSYIGQALKALRVRADSTGLEFFTPATDLNSLSDVDLTTPPSANQVLAYVDGVWKAQTFSVDVGGLDDLSDVELSAEPVAGSVLVYENGQWRDQAPQTPTFAPLTVDLPYAGAASASAYAMKGNAFQATTNFQLHAIRPYMTGSAGETYVGMVVLLTADNKFDVLLAQSPTYTKPAAMGYADLAFDAPVTLEIGKHYALVVVRTDGTAASAAGVSFPGTGGPGIQLPWMSYVGSIRLDALTPPIGANALYEQTSYVAMGVRVVGLATEFALGDLTDVDLTTPPIEGQVLTYQSGQWVAGTASSGGSVALEDLTDVDLSAAPAEGQVFTFKAGKWVAGDRKPTGAHNRWRILVHATGQDPSVNLHITEIQFRAKPNGATLATGGSPLASSGTPANAFDASDFTYWGVDMGSTPEAFLGYLFPTPVAVAEVALRSGPVSGWAQYLPTDFDVQWSDDGVTWTTAWSVEVPSPWSASQTRAFASPYPLDYFLDLADAPHSYAGQGSKLLAVKPNETGVEFVSPPTIPSTLGALSDVQDALAPAEGEVLTYKDGQWQSEPLPSSSGGSVALEDLTDVSYPSAPFAGQVLTYDDGLIEGEGPWVPRLLVLGDLGDVDFPYDPEPGQVLTYDPSLEGVGPWVARNPTVGLLDDLGDVDLTTESPAQGQVLTYVDGQWIAADGGSSGGSYRGPWGIDATQRTVTFDAGEPEGFEAAFFAGWSIVPHADVTIATTNALRATNIGHNQTTEFSFEAMATPLNDAFSLRYIQSSEINYDYLTVLVDGVVVHSAKNLAGQQAFATTLTPGPHTITVRYAKDSSTSTGDDTVYISQIVYPVETSTPYVYGDIVDWNGARYTCLTSGTVSDPSSTADWQVLTSSLVGLTDVDLTTDPPVEGDVLVFRSGQWVAGPTPAPAYRGVWTATPEDPYVAGDLVIQDGATWIGAVAMPTQQPGTGSDWIKISQRPMDVGFFFAGKPEASELLTRYQVRSAFSVAAGALSVSAVGAATASYSLLLFKNGATFATATFAAGATTASINMGVEATFAEGDILSIQGASVADTTLADLSVTMQAYRL